MPRVIVNSTPLILLSGIDRLDLLVRLYEEVVIPNAVFNEVTAKTDSASRALAARPHWLRVEQAPELPEEHWRLVSAKLHTGEIEVMSLALATGADAVVLDDNAARKAAKFFGLPVTGALGLLLRAKEHGMIAEVRPLVMAARWSWHFARTASAWTTGSSKLSWNLRTRTAAEANVRGADLGKEIFHKNGKVQVKRGAKVGHDRPPHC